MPFQKGHVPMGGRPGYEIESEQLEKMKKELGQFLILTEKIRTGKATKKDVAAYQLISKPICKIMDKIHPNRQTIDMTSKGQKIPNINVLGIDLSTKSYEELRRLIAEEDTSTRNI